MPDFVAVRGPEAMLLGPIISCNPSITPHHQVLQLTTRGFHTVSFAQDGPCRWWSQARKLIGLKRNFSFAPAIQDFHALGINCRLECLLKSQMQISDCIAEGQCSERTNLLTWNVKQFDIKHDWWSWGDPWPVSAKPAFKYYLSFHWSFNIRGLG